MSSADYGGGTIDREIHWLLRLCKRHLCRSTVPQINRNHNHSNQKALSAHLFRLNFFYDQCGLKVEQWCDSVFAGE
ncbi:hypothetical protein CEXT_154661 [Caerostris extrusa]|uniref:Uncharacterized protein n=1 Tax=Caerostris extrusa TaxID=172846 RepID=A0AAV4SYE3_CAEEX|nr:hypothetical protein CEXT_154661 [Caerostris extrusa]